VLGSPGMGAREWLVACAVAAFSFAGCTCVNSDLGTDCTLQKGNPDGGPPLPMTGADITADGQDIISLGAQGCEDFICVHDLGQPKPGPAEALTGYCTHPCSGSGEGPCPGINQEESRPYTCRALLLDEQTLRELCNANGALCDQYFGPQRSSNFCARGSRADAGT
jgi:hypothetical protein